MAGTNNAINANATGIAKYDGAGTWTATTVTQHAVIVGGASNALTSIGPLISGQLAIGSTGADPVAATLSAGTGISISNGAGSIQITATGGGVTWSVITTSTAASVNNGYGINGSGVALSLPTTSSVGSIIQIVGMTGSWSVTQAAGQQINVGTAQSTLGATGFISSNHASDCVTMVCLVANTIWYCFDIQGNINWN